MLRNRDARLGQESVRVRLVFGAVGGFGIVQRDRLALDARGGCAEPDLEAVRLELDDLRSELGSRVRPERARDLSPTAGSEARQAAVASPAPEGVDDAGRTGEINAGRNRRPYRKTPIYIR
jgi:hypothetical protein